MAVKPVPDGYHTVTPYLMADDVEGLIEFVQEAFDGRLRGGQVARDAQGRIMHAEMQIGDSVVMMSQATDEFAPKSAMLHLYVEDVDDVYRRALDAGGESLREPTDEFYGDRSAGVADDFGNEWWIATHVEDVSPEEMQRRMEAGV